MSGITCPDPALVLLAAPGGERLPRAAPEPSPAGPALLRRLGPPDLAAVERHLLALGPEDRRTRFLSRFGDAVISAYVRRIDPVAGILFGALDGPEGELLGLAEAYPTGAPDRVEVAVSVLPPHRRRGLGRRLVGRAVAAGFAAGAAVAEFHLARRTWPWCGWWPRSAVASGKRRPNCIGAAEGRAASAATAVRPHLAMNVL
jgi:GNAT superfamily N-acetyltransferase